MPETIKGLATRTTKTVKAEVEKVEKDVKADVEKDVEEVEGLTSEEFRAAREAYLRAWPLEAEETR